MFFIILSRTSRVSLASGDKSLSTVGPSISWCLKFGFSLGYGLESFSFSLSESDDDDDDDGSLVDKNLGFVNWAKGLLKFETLCDEKVGFVDWEKKEEDGLWEKGSKIGNWGLLNNGLVEDDGDWKWEGFRIEEVNLNLREMMAAIRGVWYEIDWESGEFYSLGTRKVWFCK